MRKAPGAADWKSRLVPTARDDLDAVSESDRGRTVHLCGAHAERRGSCAPQHAPLPDDLVGRSRAELEGCPARHGVNFGIGAACPQLFQQSVPISSRISGEGTIQFDAGRKRAEARGERRNCDTAAPRRILEAIADAAVGIEPGQADNASARGQRIPLLQRRVGAVEKRRQARRVAVRGTTRTRAQSPSDLRPATRCRH